MPEFNILVDRTAVRSKTIRITADSLEEAMSRAEEEAPNHDFTGSGNGVEYQALSGIEVPPVEVPEAISKSVHPISLPGDIDCQRCGSCCKRFIVGGGSDLFDDKLWERHYPAVLARLRGLFVETDVTEEVPGEKTHWYRCTQLHIDPDGKAACLVYDNRPEMCSIFAPGNYSCPPEYPCAKIRAERLKALGDDEITEIMCSEEIAAQAGE
jgi:Fe-S-cluster containining protein